MWEIGLLLFTGTLGAIGLWESRRERLRLQSLRAAAQLCGLRVESTSIPFKTPLRIEARAGSTKVWIEDAANGGQRLRLQVRIKIEGPPGFAGVRIRPEKEKPSGAREIEIGDERFDSLFYLEGPSRLLSVLLDAETRRLLVRASAEGRLNISGGEIRVKPPSDKDVATLLPILLDLVPRLSGEVVTEERLAENARKDPVAGVRLHNLLVLVREFPGDPETVRTLRAACSDPSPEVRLRAGMALLGPEGRAALAELAESLDDDASSARAVAHLGRDLPVDRTSALLTQALRRRRLQTVRACLEVLGQSGDEGAEPLLLRALQHEEMDIRVAAASALGRTGTAAAVLPLKEEAESLRNLELRRVARQAIAEIQSRLQGASPGQLSLAGTESGQLSLATDPAGQLSLPPREPEKHGI